MAELDFGKLLGFRHVVAARGSDFAKAVGASLNKNGEVPPAKASEVQGGPPGNPGETF